MIKKIGKKYKIAVYGSLRRGEYNYKGQELDTQTYLGTFETEPIFSLYSSGSYPCLKEGGTTSIVMDVFEVDEDTFKGVNQLEGYRGAEFEATNFYNRKMIATPFGEAAYFVFNDSVKSMPRVESGDWVQYRAQNTTAKTPVYTC